MITMKINIEEAKEEFIKYTENFNTKDKNVKRKQQHSIRVMKIAEQIATNLKLSEEQIQLATLIGLLHDIGRFKQYTDIGLGNNLEGFDHGDYGTKLLFKEGLIRKFIETNKYISSEIFFLIFHCFLRKDMQQTIKNFHRRTHDARPRKPLERCTAQV